MTDRDFWLIVRRALLMVVRAIEKKYPADNVPLEEEKGASYSVVVDDSN